MKVLKLIAQNDENETLAAAIEQALQLCTQMRVNVEFSFGQERFIVNYNDVVSQIKKLEN